MNENSPQQEQEPRLAITRLKKRPANRNERRRAERETRTILKMLMPIEMKFNRDILIDPENDYKEIYDLYLKQWQLALFAIERMDIRLVEANAQYFSQMFSPKER